MKRLEKDSKTKLFIPGPVAKCVLHILKKNLQVWKIYYFNKWCDTNNFIKSQDKVGFDISSLFFVSYLSRNYLTQ